jgi:TRAP-type C4-dicarboxylate transport system permease small subunit
LTRPDSPLKIHRLVVRREAFHNVVNKIVFFICGIVLILSGIRIMHNPVYYSYIYGITMDFTEFRIPFGLLLIITGVLSIVCRVKRITCRLKSDHGSSVVRPCSLREVLRVT